MAEIRIDAGKAERFIDIARPRPNASSQSERVCRKHTLAAHGSHAAPTTEPLSDYRAIRRQPPYGSDFAFAVAKILADAKGDPALYPEPLWEAVYDADPGVLTVA